MTTKSVKSRVEEDFIWILACKTQQNAVKHQQARLQFGPAAMWCPIITAEACLALARRVRLTNPAAPFRLVGGYFIHLQPSSSPLDLENLSSAGHEMRHGLSNWATGLAWR